MNDISKQNLEALIKLQEAETQIVKLKAVLGKVETEREKLSEKLKQFGDGLKEKQEKLAIASKACTDIENEMQVIYDRIIKSNENLRMVKTNKEYQVLLREVDDNKKRKDALETDLLEYLDEKEQLETTVLEKKKEYDLLKDQIQAEQKEIKEKSSDDQQQLDEYIDQQKEIGKTLDTSLMNRFAKISKMNNGLAVVNVKNEVCMGCFLNIPPQLYIEVQRGNSLISCPQCSRILYYINE